MIIDTECSDEKVVQLHFFSSVSPDFSLSGIIKPTLLNLKL